MSRLSRVLFLSLAAVGAAASPSLADDDLPPLSIYGFARLDMLVNDSSMSSLEDPSYVEPEVATGQMDGELTMTPRLSRLGLGIDQWEIKGSRVTGEGKLEIDFAGGSGVNTIRLRHAYGAINFGRKQEAQLLMGQTFDLMSPLFPAAQNDGQLRHAGNIGDRRAQVRLTLQPTNKVQMAVAGAAPSTVDRRDLDGDGAVDAMMSTAKPMVQWLVEYRTRLGKPRYDDDGEESGGTGDVVRLGVSGHVTAAPRGDERSASSLAGHFFLPFAPMLVVLGEGYVGNNMADLGGGIGQGIHPMTNRMVRSIGGWVELAMLPTKRHMYAVGTSIDVARGSDLQDGDRERNGTIYNVLRYKPRPTLQLGLEHLYWKTEYKNMGQGVANRFDVHFSVFF